MQTQAGLFKPGDNCWQMARASRAAVLIDGENYFPAFRQAVLNARQRVLILSWDIDSRMRLVREPGTDDGVPAELGHVLCHALQHNPQLQIYILNWDWAMLYTLEREWLPNYKPLWLNQPRLHFELDGACPGGASQHQKVVVVDDVIAFSGGFDLGKHRWDSSEHAANDKRRCDPDNKPYPPFHDVQMLVEGEAAEKLAQLARERWRRATGRTLPGIRPAASAESPWPVHIKPDFTDVEVAIALTQPALDQVPEQREVERLYQDSIAAAETLIYMENQYFTSWVIAEALAARLQEPDGPDVVMVLPKMTGGWMEQYTMDVLRFRVMQVLEKADIHHRLRVCYPHRDALGDGWISVHSKTTIIDDRLLRISSSNLSNRSMGFDSECDLAIEAHSDADAQTIRDIRHRLLSEHLGVDQQSLPVLLEQHGGLRALIDARAEAPHTLRKLDYRVDEWADELLPESHIVDPEKPLEPEDMARLLLPINAGKAFKRQWITGLSVIVLLLILTAAWRFTPLADYVNEASLQSAAQTIQAYPLAPVMIIGAFALSSLLALPVTLLIMATAVTFGPWIGSFYAITGSLAGAWLGFWIGHLLGRRSIQKVAGSTLEKLSRRLARRGMLAVMTVRIVPVAPFTVINLVAGASHIRLRDYTWGTVLGMLPGITAIAVFADSLVAVIKNPQPAQIAVFGAILAAIVVLTTLLQRYFRRSEQTLADD